MSARPFIEQLGSKDGLSNNEVRCIFQDSRGFMWFGTYDGLNRYDGYDFKVFRNNPKDPGSIIHSFINTIAEDSRHAMWIGTRQGVSVLDPITLKFTKVFSFRPGIRISQKLTSFVTSIKTDKTGDIFVATQNNGLVIFDHSSKGPGMEIPFWGPGGNHWNYSVSTLFFFDEHLFLLIEGKGLCIYDRHNKRLLLLNSKLKKASCIYGENNLLWIGTNAGLYRYNIGLNSFEPALTETDGGLSSGRITCLKAMPGDKLWIGTDGGGISILNKKTQRLTYLTGGFRRHALSSNAVYSIFLDNENRKWIGTLRGGINIIDDVKNRFQNIVQDPTLSNSLINNFVKSLYEDTKDRIWIGTDGGGLSIWDRKNEKYENYVYKKNQYGSLSSNFITSIKQDYTGKTWVATYSSGIDLFQPQTKTFKTYVGLDEQGKANHKFFWLLFEDHFKNLWASGLQDGLFLYDRANDQFRLFDPSVKNILAFHEDLNGQLWAGTFDGLFQLDIKNKKHKYYAIGKPVRAIHEDKKHQFWIGTEAGLMLFNKNRTEVVKQFTTDDGLSSNNILGIEEEKGGDLWLSTFNGLSKFNSQSGKFTNFTQSDGLQNKEFNFNASLTLRSGEMAFGGINGLSIFLPEKILPLKNKPNLVATAINLNNHSINDQANYISAITDQQISEITVPYNRASLSVKFAAIEFTAQERINYRYVMKGWDRGWNNSGQNRNAVYTRLNPGTYTLLINCTNAEGQWISKTISLRVIVLPPWYLTWWAITFYIGILICCVYWFLNYRFRETRLRYEIKIAKANADNQQKLQEKERELNERRVEFFTGISHEFRTPLSLIINPIKDILTRNGNENRNDLSLVYRNARRLLSLVDQLLLFRKAEAGAENICVTPLNIGMVCQEVFLCFVQQAKAADLTFELTVPEEEVIIYGEREKIEIILFNLISNAIKYSPHGKIVKVQLHSNQDDVLIKVIDNGNGIPTTIGDKIFNKFYRSRDAGHPVKAGFGIGLYLAKQFTDDHFGTLTYESAPNSGTTFLLKLKKGIAHYPENAVSLIADSSSEILSELSDQPLVLNDNLGVNVKTEEFLGMDIFSDRKSVLIIDDDLDIRKYIKSILESQYIIFEAEDGNSGLLLAREKNPSLIICDVMMPGMNGLELCSLIKKDPSMNFIPMILLTASSSPEGKIKGLESGADDYISKPFESDVLTARVANLLLIRSNLQNYFYNAITLKSAEINISDEYKQFLEKCITIVEAHMTDSNFNTQMLAAELGVSRSNLFRKVKSLSGHNINGFIRFIRLRKAAELLIQTELNVNEVALGTGFNEIKYFRTQFHKLFKTNPSDFAKQNRRIFKKKYNVIE